MADKNTSHPFGPHGPYDPRRHHHPDHPPYMVDRCADECDDQLPLFSQVGRGLQGNGYKVEVIKDALTETILEGLVYDPYTGALTSDWVSENINGGHLSYAYNLRPFTDPQTFTISFKYVRPGRNADENGTVWSWTTPAIPYLWSRQEDGSMSDGEDIVGTGVATLYLKKTTEPTWNWRLHEKLVYPDGFTHEDMNAPDPLEGWTVNLQYGIGGDIDAPNIDDLSKVLGITVQNIRNIIANSPVPTDTIDQPNLKKYIDWVADTLVSNIVVTSKWPGRLKVTRTDTARNGNTPKKTTFELDPIKPTAGAGIEITEATNGALTIKNTGILRVNSGIGIQVENNNDGSVTINNTQVGGKWKVLTPDVDFQWKTHNGWYFGPNPSFILSPDRKSDVGGNAHRTTNSRYLDANNVPIADKVAADPYSQSRYPAENPPRVRVILSEDSDGEITSADVYIDEYNVKRTMWTDANKILHPENCHAMFCIYNLLETVEAAQYDEWKIRNFFDPDNPGDLSDWLEYDDNNEPVTRSVSRMGFRHSYAMYNAPTAPHLSLKFKGQYAALNDMSVVSGSTRFSGVPNFSGRVDGGNIYDDTLSWRNVGARWEPKVGISKLASSAFMSTFSQVAKCKINRSYLDFIFYWSAPQDGYNSSINSPKYEYNGTPIDSLTTAGHVNYGLAFTLA